MPRTAVKEHTHVVPPPTPAYKEYTIEELEQLAIQDPEKAQKIIDLMDSLAKKRQESVSKRSLLQMRINNMQEVERSAEERARLQAACTRQGHVRPDGHTRLQGQYVGQGRDRVLQLTCNYCYKQYTGIGEGKESLPMTLANQLDLTEYGG